MNDRLSAAAARSGDDGQTNLGAGTRTDKDSPPIETLGAIDELNTWIGALAAMATSAALRDRLLDIQHDLFDLAVQINSAEVSWLSSRHISRVERFSEELGASLEPAKSVILPGGGQFASSAHIARAVCRRAERRLVSLRESYPPSETCGIAYLNRLSDFLFAAARAENLRQGRADVSWEHTRSLSAAPAD